MAFNKDGLNSGTNAITRKNPLNGMRVRVRAYAYAKARMMTMIVDNAATKKLL